MLRNDPQEKHQLRGTLLKTSRGKILVTYSILPMIGITFWWQMFRPRFQGRQVSNKKRPTDAGLVDPGGRINLCQAGLSR